MACMKEKMLLDEAGVALAVGRVVESIAAQGRDLPLVLVGIHTRGVPVARRVAAAMGDAVAGIGTLDISLYRDDLDSRGTLPVLRGSDIPAPVDGARVVLCDDVLFTGRTIRAALDGITALGRPARVELAVLVDRGGRELPIQADHVGHSVETNASQRVRVRLSETDDGDCVMLYEVGPEGES